MRESAIDQMRRVIKGLVLRMAQEVNAEYSVSHLSRHVSPDQGEWKRILIEISLHYEKKPVYLCSLFFKRTTTTQLAGHVTIQNVADSSTLHIRKYIFSPQTSRSITFFFLVGQKINPVQPNYTDRPLTCSCIDEERKGRQQQQTVQHFRWRGSICSQTPL